MPCFMLLYNVYLGDHSVLVYKINWVYWPQSLFYLGRIPLEVTSFPCSVSVPLAFNLFGVNGVARH